MAKTQSDYDAIAQALAQDEFDEGQHPRDNHGKFGAGSGEKKIESPLKKTDAEIVKEAHDLYNDPATLAAYAAIPESDGGRKIDVDLARQLDPNYLADPARVAGVHHEEVSKFGEKLFNARMDMPVAEADEHVVFLAGGGGSGKSTVRDNFKLDAGAQTLVDGTMQNYDKAHAKIERALSTGRKVVYDVVLCPVQKAVAQTITRANSQEHGRVVGLDVLATAHSSAPLTALRLMKDYDGDKRVAFRVFENAGRIKDVHEVSEFATKSTILKYSENPKQISATAISEFHKIAEHGYDDQNGHHQNLRDEIRSTVQASVKRMDTGATEASWRQSISGVKSWAEGSGRKVGAHDQRCSITQDGEGAGHAFHGNQHTGGTGRVDRARVAKATRAALTSTDAEKIALLHTTISDEAKKQGIPESKISYSKEDEYFNVGDEKNFEEAAHFDPQTGGIVIRENGMKEEPVEKMRETLSHECGHMFFEAALDRLRAQSDQHDKLEKMIAADPKSPANVALTAEKKALEATIDKEGFGNVFDNHNMEMLKQEDGVSNYSASYWKATSKETDEQANKSGSRITAMHETFAEIHAHLSVCDKPKLELAALKSGKPGWWHVYTEVMAVHKEIAASWENKK
jgi:predicted GNAT family acetyltransferase